MRWNLVALLALGLLAGCLDGDDTPAVAATPSAGDAGNTTTPDPVSIHEDADLLEGFPETTWEIPIHAAGTGAITVRLDPSLPGGVVATQGGFCFRYTLELSSETGQQVSRGGQCSDTGGLSISIGGSNELYQRAFDGTAWGTATLTFRADSQPARFVLDADITY